MAPIQTVAVAGAAGSLGEALVKELLAANFSVTALVRPGSTSTLSPSVKAAKVDYEDMESLKTALQGHDALVSTLSTTAIKVQEKLIDAAIAAGIKRYIPSEFGCDLFNPKARALPVYAQKLKVEEDVEKKTQGTQTTYTFVFNNAFLDWGLDHGFLMDLKAKKAEIYDGGNVTFTATPIPFVAKGVVAVLQHPEETANREVRLHGAAVTQKQILDIAQRVGGKEGWQVTEARSEDLERESYENLKKDPSNVYGWIVGMLKRAAFADGYGGDFSLNNDNAMLGLNEMSEREIDDIVRSRM
ncbi:hypothetical protein LTR37_009548 [Vermiconidia calcicola]|uniref:Uncharacterized protein n=1 Tax=Vermiconidia calcicola TaxID=1690605 RepID=A0ACC3N7N1_9PEZI|nr:hypothetical protein LTR37_009548 [Vermiconidia calcicola]